MDLEIVQILYIVDAKCGKRDYLAVTFLDGANMTVYFNFAVNANLVQRSSKFNNSTLIFYFVDLFYFVLFINARILFENVYIAIPSGELTSNKSK